MGLDRLLLYLAAFGFLSLGASLIVDTISSFTKRLRVAPFVFSFFIGGLVTSVAEIAVGINAVSIGQPEIFVGSIIGGTLVIFLLVFPLMTILSHGLPVKKHITDRRLLATLAIFATPALVAMDHTVTRLDAVLLILLYFTLFLIIKTPGERPVDTLTATLKKPVSLRDNPVLRLIIGTGVVFMSSRFIVEQTLVYAEHFHVSAFVVSLIVVAIGTNLPEIALAIKAASSHQLKAQDIALGDFLGSAATNVLLIGVFTLFTAGAVTISRSFTTAFLCTILAVVSFFAFTRGKSILTIKESIVLISVYLLFVFTQFVAA